MKMSQIYLYVLCCIVFLSTEGISQPTSPIAVEDHYEMNQNGTLERDVAANDLSLENPVYRLIAGTAKGNIILNADGTFIFTPYYNLCGAASFRYEVCNDGDANRCDQAIVEIEIRNIYELSPVELISSCGITLEGNINNYYTLPNDGIFSLENPPAEGDLDLQADGRFTFTPLATDCASVSFSFKVCWANDAHCCRRGNIEFNVSNGDGCDFYATIIENNCCTICPTGNLEVKTAYWQESNTNLVATNIALNKPAIFNGTPNHQSSNAHLSNDGKFEGENQTFYDYAFSSFGTNNRWDIDLVGSYDLEELRIHTKEGCCLGDASEYEVYISAAPFQSEEVTILRNQPDLFRALIPITTDTPNIIDNLNTIGRFVRVYLLGEGQMQLVEVEVIGSGRLDSSPYEYRWSDNTIGNTPTPACLEPGTYELEIEDTATGCIAETVVAID